MKRKKIVLISITIILTSIIFAASTQKADKEKGPSAEEKLLTLFNDARPVTIERVKSKLVTTVKKYPGSVKASEETNLSFRVGGPLVDVTVSLGDSVAKGDLLMKIDPRDFDNSIANLKAVFAGAEARFTNAEKDYQRISRLFADKVIPQADFDMAESAYHIAMSSLDSARVNLKISEDKKKDSELIAPYKGVIVSQYVENFEMINPGQVVLAIQNIDELEVEINIPENDMIKLKLKKGMPASVKFHALTGESFSLSLKEWSTKADPVTKTYKAVFTLKSPADYQILPGMTAEVEWHVRGYGKQVITVPLSAVSGENGNSSYVWVYDENSSSPIKRNVVLGKLDGASRVTIVEGLKLGEGIITGGSKFIHEDMKLTIAPETETNSNGETL